jgi:hypothetical protein
VLIFSLNDRHLLPSSLQLAPIRQGGVDDDLVYSCAEFALQLKLWQCSERGQHRILIDIVGIIGGVGKPRGHSQHLSF